MSAIESELIDAGPILVHEPENQRKFKFTSLHIFSFVICTVIGREYSLWQPALSHGFGIFGVAQLLVAGAFINYFLCLCEVWSAIPFSGGGYGLTRASLGFFIGFLDGCNESLVYIVHTSVSAMFLGTTLCKVFEVNSHYSLLFMFVFYVLAVGVTVQSNLNILRWTYIALTVVSVVVLMIFCFGALKFTDFMENASLHSSSNPASFDNWFHGGMKEFMTLLQYSTLPYAGIKSFTLLCPVTEEPKKNIPSGAVYGFSTIFCINMLVIFVTASLPGGIVHTSSLPAPMGLVFRLLFKTNIKETFRITGLLSLPASFAKMVAYVLPCGIILHSLGSTNLLPSVLCLNKSKDYTRGCIISGCLGYMLCILMFFVPAVDLYGVAIISTMFSNIVALYGYIQLGTTYSTIERGFTAPFGKYGAVYAMIVFVAVFVSVAFFQDSYFALEFMIVYFVLLAIFYYGFAEKTQTLSEEEDKIMLQLHVRNYNIQKKRALHRHIRQGAKRVAAEGHQPGTRDLVSSSGQKEVHYAVGGASTTEVETKAIVTPSEYTGSLGVLDTNLFVAQEPMEGAVSEDCVDRGASVEDSHPV